MRGEMPADGKPPAPFDGDEASQGDISDVEHDMSSSSTTASSDMVSDTHKLHPHS